MHMGGVRGIVGRSAVVLAGLLVVMTVAVPSASAATGRAVTGPVTGSAPFDFAGCSFVHQTYVGDITTPGGIAKLDVDLCVDLKGSGCTAKGSFSIKEGAGKVRGGSTGTIDCLSTRKAIAFDFTLHVRSSTPGLANVGQNLHFRGKWHSDQVSGGPFTGKVSPT
jgi:hypothetical protein